MGSKGQSQAGRVEEGCEDDSYASASQCTHNSPVICAIVVHQIFLPLPLATRISLGFLDGFFMDPGKAEEEGMLFA